jgi:hypothetical protein
MSYDDLLFAVLVPILSLTGRHGSRRGNAAAELLLGLACTLVLASQVGGEPPAVPGWVSSWSGMLRWDALLLGLALLVNVFVGLLLTQARALIACLVAVAITWCGLNLGVIQGAPAVACDPTPEIPAYLRHCGLRATSLALYLSVWLFLAVLAVIDLAVVVKRRHGGSQGVEA